MRKTRSADGVPLLSQAPNPGLSLFTGREGTGIRAGALLAGRNPKVATHLHAQQYYGVGPALSVILVPLTKQT